MHISALFAFYFTHTHISLAVCKMCGICVFLFEPLKWLCNSLRFCDVQTWLHLLR